MNNPNKAIRLSLSLLLVALLTATSLILNCSSDTPTEPGDQKPIMITVTPATSRSTALTWIALEGLPNDTSGYYGIVTTVAKSIDTGYAAVIQSDSGNFLIMPLYPTNPIGGGDVQVVLTNGDQVFSEPMNLTIDSLPQAPGEFVAIVTLLQDILGEHLRLSGINRDSLAYIEPSEIPLSRVPYVIAYSIIDDPTNLNSLRAQADGPIPYLDNMPIDVDLVNRLLAYMEIRAYFEELAAILDTSTVSFTSVEKAGSYNQMANASQACLPAPDYGITSCSQLASAMTEQNNRAFAKNSASEEVISDLIKGTVKAVSLIPGAAPITATIGGMLWTKDVMEKGFIDMLPSEFVDDETLFDPSITEFPEDFTSPGVWTKFKVTATSKGWILNQIAIDALLQMIKARKAGLKKEIKAFDPGKEINNALESMYKGSAQKRFYEEFNNAVGDIMICPKRWSNIDCVGEQFSEVVVSSGPLKVNQSAKTYEPTDIGSAVLRIETKNEFGLNITGVARVIKTEPIEIFIDPYQAEADTSESISFVVRVEHANDKNVKFSLTGGGNLIENNVSAIVKTPGTPWAPPLTLKAVSLASTGLRATSTESREDTAPIAYRGGGEAFLTPSAICLKPNQKQTFKVIFTGGPIDNTTWELDPAGVGSLNKFKDSAVYTAPSNLAGPVSIRATVNGKYTAVANVDVSSCVCNWIFEATGDGGFIRATGEWGKAADLANLLQLVLSQTSSDFSLPNLIISAVDISDTGTYEIDGMSFTFEDAELNPTTWSSQRDTTRFPPLMQITAYVENDYVEGVVFGELSRQVEYGIPPVYAYIDFSLTFRAEYANFNRPQCVDDK